MLEVLRFIFKDGEHFIGTCILLLCCRFIRISIHPNKK